MALFFVLFSLVENGCCYCCWRFSSAGFLSRFLNAVSLCVDTAADECFFVSMTSIFPHKNWNSFAYLKSVCCSNYQRFSLVARSLSLRLWLQTKRFGFFMYIFSCFASLYFFFLLLFSSRSRLFSGFCQTHKYQCNRLLLVLELFVFSGIVGKLEFST